MLNSASSFNGFPSIPQASLSEEHEISKKNEPENSPTAAISEERSAKVSQTSSRLFMLSNTIVQNKDNPMPSNTQPIA